MGGIEQEAVVYIESRRSWLRTREGRNRSLLDFRATACIGGCDADMFFQEDTVEDRRRAKKLSRFGEAWWGRSSEMVDWGNFRVRQVAEV